MNEIKLKPCPFCGGEAVMYHQSSKYTDHDGDYVYCMACGCRTKLFECFNGTGKTHDDTEKEAMNAWNGRVDDVPSRATALSVLKEFSRDMYPSNDIFGKPTLVVGRKAFETIRKKYLDTDYCERSEFEKIATKIFDEIEASIAVHAFTNKSDDYAEGAFDTIEFVDSKIDELRKKHLGGAG